MSHTPEPDTKATNSSDLPPRRGQHKPLRPVSPPLAHTPLHRFNYALALAAAALLAFYAWRLLQWKAAVGGWWNLALGHRPPGADAVLGPSGGGGKGAAHTTSATAGGGSVEDKIGDLAKALGMDSPDLAAAIADAVRAHVPPASLSSVAAHEPSG